MKRQTLLKSTLCLLMALLCNVAWAQTNTNGPIVTFTNVQQDGTTTFTLYINENGQLATSTSSAAELGDAAKFRAIPKENGKWAFYNESKGLYMILRGKSAGHIGYRLALGSHADQPVPVFGKSDDGRRRPASLGIRNDNRPAVFHKADTGVRRSKVNSKYFCHNLLLNFLSPTMGDARFKQRPCQLSQNHAYASQNFKPNPTPFGDRPHLRQ